MSYLLWDCCIYTNQKLNNAGIYFRDRKKIAIPLQFLCGKNLHSEIVSDFVEYLMTCLYKMRQRIVSTFFEDCLIILHDRDDRICQYTISVIYELKTRWKTTFSNARTHRKCCRSEKLPNTIHRSRRLNRGLSEPRTVRRPDRSEPPPPRPTSVRRFSSASQLRVVFLGPDLSHPVALLTPLVG